MRKLILMVALAGGLATSGPLWAADDGKSAGEAAASEARPGLFVAQGETWIFKLKDGEPVDARRVDDKAKPEDGELMVSLSGGMMHIVSRTEKPYNYQAFLARNAKDKGERTSVCTLMPGVPVMEMWPGTVPGIRITNFAEAGDGMRCA